MTVFKYFLKLVERNKGTFLIYLIIFFVLSILNGGDGKASEAFKETLPKAVIVNEDNSEISKELEQYLKENSKLPDGAKEGSITENNAREIIYEDSMDIFVKIPKGYGEDFDNSKPTLLLLKDSLNPNAMKLEMETNKFLSFLKASKKVEGSYNFAKVKESLKEKSEVRFLNNDKQKQEKFEKIKFYFIFASYPILATLIALIGVVMKEITDKKVNLRNSILPIPSSNFNLQLMAGQLAVGFIVAAVFLLGAFVLMKGEALDLPWAGILTVGAALTLSYVALAFLLTNISSNKHMVNIFSTVVSLGISFISGVMVPAEFLAPEVVTFSKFFPTYYYVEGIQNIFKGKPFMKETMMMLLMTLFFGTLAIVISKIKKGEFTPKRKELAPTLAN